MFSYNTKVICFKWKLIAVCLHSWMTSTPLASLNRSQQRSPNANKFGRISDCLIITGRVVLIPNRYLTYTSPFGANFNFTIALPFQATTTKLCSCHIVMILSSKCLVYWKPTKKGTVQEHCSTIGVKSHNPVPERSEGTEVSKMAIRHGEWSVLA